LAFLAGSSTTELSSCLGSLTAVSSCLSSLTTFSLEVFSCLGSLTAFSFTGVSSTSDFFSTFEAVELFCVLLLVSLSEELSFFLDDLTGLPLSTLPSISVIIFSSGITLPFFSTFSLGGVLLGLGLGFVLFGFSLVFPFALAWLTFLSLSESF